MSKTESVEADRHLSVVEGLLAQLKALDTRIARMREMHAGSGDPLALRLIEHSLVERAEVAAKLPQG